MCHLLSLVQVLLAIFEAFVCGVNILSCLSKILVIPFPYFIFWNIPHSKAVKTAKKKKHYNCIFKSYCFFSFLTDSFGLVDSLKISISYFNLICCSNA